MRGTRSILLVFALASGCDHPPSMEAPTPLGPSGRPALGPQIDRAGRPAISTALLGTFSSLADRNDVRDRYNQASPDSWSGFAVDVESSLAILDALDGVCGNQLLAGEDDATRYAALRDVLLDDRLYVNRDATTCGVYLGVEGEAIGALPEGAGGCGGRTPNDDVVERSYSLLAAGTLTGIDDLVTGDAADHSVDVFPFLAPPTP